MKALTFMLPISYVAARIIDKMHPLDESQEPLPLSLAGDSPRGMEGFQMGHWGLLMKG